MVTLSSHALNSVDGTHAGGIRLCVCQISPRGERKVLIKSVTDEDGQFSEAFQLTESDIQSSFEMVLQTGEFFAYQSLPHKGLQIINEVVIRFELSDVEGQHHIQLMLAPNSYSMWWPS